MLKKAIKTGIKLTKEWLRDEPAESRQEENYDKDAFLYRVLNSTFRNITV